MKKAIFILGLITFSIWAVNAIAEIPQMINYQGRLTDANGSPISDTVEVTFGIYNAETEGDLKWAEIHPSVIMTNGLFNVILGSLNPIPVDIFDDSNRYLSIQIEGNPEVAPRTRLTSVAYAYNAEKLDGYDAEELLNWPGDPSGVFRCYVHADGGVSTLCSGPGLLREITGIVVAGSGPAMVEIRVGGEGIMKFYSQESRTHIWSRNDGAGIIVESHESVEIYTAPGADAWVTILGYEY